MDMGAPLPLCPSDFTAVPATGSNRNGTNAQIRYSPAEMIVLVGHSHLLRELLQTKLHDSFTQREPELASQLRSLKLSNCGVARLELDFELDSGRTPIVDCRLLAGTELVR